MTGEQDLRRKKLIDKLPSTHMAVAFLFLIEKLSLERWRKARLS
jgi:hypothetical protein